MKAKKRILYIGLALWLIAFLQMIHTGLNPVSEEEAIGNYTRDGAKIILKL